MSSHQFVNDLISLANVPIAAPSANLSGHLSGTNLDDIFGEFSDSVDYIVNGGKSEFGIESTVVRVIDGIPNILRPGFITKEQIEKVAGKVILNTSTSPSNHLKHYQLDASSVLIFSDNKEKMIYFLIVCILQMQMLQYFQVLNFFQNQQMQCYFVENSYLQYILLLKVL